VYMLLVVICLTLTLSDVVVQSLRERRHEPRTMTAKQKSDIVDEHNILRAQEGAADMELMTWSDTLAAAAKEWASECTKRHGFPALPDESGTTSYGQNVYSKTGDRIIVMMVVVQQWYNEKLAYNYDTLGCDTSIAEMCGHYTQVVWATSRQVGCAYYNCIGVEGFSSESSLHLVCNYLPGGNYDGAKPFKKGAACSKCASGAGWCKNGLCNSACSSPGKDCSCAAHCYNCAKLDLNTCRCSCADGWRGTDCSLRCEDISDQCLPDPKPGDAGWPPGYCNHRRFGPETRRLCPAMCNLCTADPDAEAGKCEPVYGPDAASDADLEASVTTTSDANLTASDANSTTSSTASAMVVLTQPLMTMMMMMMMMMMIIILSINNIAAL